MSKHEESTLSHPDEEEDDDVTRPSPIMEGSGGEKKKKGRPVKRRASANTRLFGHFLKEKIPRSTWIVGVMHLDKDPGVDLFRRTMMDRLLSMPRFRSTLVVSRWGGHFRELETVDESYHFEVVDTSGLDNGSMTYEQLHVLTSELSEWKYDLDKPLWKCTYVPKMEDGRATLITNINHAIGDGVSQVEVLMKLCDEGHAAEQAAANPTAALENEKEAEGRPQQVQKRTGKSKLWRATRAKIFAGGVYEGIFAAFSKPDPPNSLKLKDFRKPASTKLVAATGKIDLNRVKEVKNKISGATLNDVLMALMSLVLRAFYEEVDDECLKRRKPRVRAQFPINLRKIGDEVMTADGDPHNSFAYGFMTVPIKKAQGSKPLLVLEIKRQIDRIKVSPSPYVQVRLLKSLLKVMPRKMLLDQTLQLASSATAQLSNVAGPQERIHLAGAVVDDLMFYLFSPLGIYLGLLSYDGKVSAGINVDGSLGVDPKEIAKHWVPMFEALYEETMKLAAESPDGMVHRNQKPKR